MKRLVCCILICSILLCSVSCAFATYDLTAIKSNQYLTIDVETDTDAAFIESTFTVKDRSFEHSMESDYKYSSTQFDILVVDYSKTASYPVWRLWTTINTDGSYMYFNSVTFTVNDTDYTFSGVSDSDWYYTDDTTYTQQLLIKFNYDNIDFLAALENLVNTWMDGEAEIDDLSVPVVFHGTTDVTATLGKGFLLEFVLFKYAVIDSSVTSYFNEVIGTEMTVSSH